MENSVVNEVISGLVFVFVCIQAEALATSGDSIVRKGVKHAISENLEFILYIR